jgi:hypothetical protein
MDEERELLDAGWSLEYRVRYRRPGETVWVESQAWTQIEESVGKAERLRGLGYSVELMVLFALPPPD